MAENGDSSAYWREVLQKLVTGARARGGAVWLIEGRQLRLETAVGRSPSDFYATSEMQLVRQRLLSDVTQQLRANASDPLSAGQQAGNVTAVILSAPLTTNGRLVGVAEIVQPPPASPQQLEGQLQSLELAGRLTDQILPQPLPPITPPAAEPSAAPPAESAVDWPAVMDWLKQLGVRSNLADVAGAIANEGRLLWQVDRVSVVVARGRGVKVIAVSGQDQVHPRANLMQAMRRLTKLVMETREPFRYGDRDEELPPPLEAPLAEFAQLGGARFILIVPLLEPADETPPDENRTQRPERAVLGAVVIEQMRHSQPEPALVAHLDLVRDHLAAALKQAVWRDTIFLLPVWTALGRFRRWLRGRRLAAALLAAAAVAGLTAALFVVPWDFRIDGKGRLMPVVQRDVFAPWDGQVVELYVTGGERVSEKQPLLLLRNDDLQAELVTRRSERDEKQKLELSLKAQTQDAERRGDRDEATRLQGKAIEAKIEFQGLDAQVRILQERIERLLVRSPIHGVVTTFQAEQLLLQRPVQRGEGLLEVMDDRGAWRLELEVPEHRTGHILAAQAEHGPDLPIAFRLLTQPEKSYAARLADVGTRSVTSEEQGSVVELTAALADGEVDQPSIGAQVRARIGCGKRPLGYCLFGDVIEFVQKYLWW